MPPLRVKGLEALSRIPEGLGGFWEDWMCHRPRAFAATLARRAGRRRKMSDRQLWSNAMWVDRELAVGMACWSWVAEWSKHEGPTSVCVVQGALGNSNTEGSKRRKRGSKHIGWTCAGPQRVDRPGHANNMCPQSCAMAGVILSLFGDARRSRRNRNACSRLTSSDITPASS